MVYLGFNSLILNRFYSSSWHSNSVYSILLSSMEDTKKRINRIIGQLRGIEKMIEAKRECHEVLQQISAAKKAIDGLSKEIVISDICKLIPNEDSKRIGRMVERAINL